MKEKKTWYKNKTVWKWIGISIIAMAILGKFFEFTGISDKIEAQKEERAEEQSKKETEKATHDTTDRDRDKAKNVKSSMYQEKEDSPPAEPTKPLTKNAVLSKFAVDSDSKPYIDGTFNFVGSRTDTADYYELADNDKYRNASVIFKDGQIARVKLIPGEGQDVNKLFESFGITDEPRKLSGAAGAYEVALIPIFWSQNIEKYPFELE